jgi:hypothetical protein
MRLVYANPDKTGITVTLDEGETLALMNGPGTFSVPCDPANTDYAAVVEQGLSIEPYAPPPSM